LNSFNLFGIRHPAEHPYLILFCLVIIVSRLPIRARDQQLCGGSTPHKAPFSASFDQKLTLSRTVPLPSRGPHCPLTGPVGGELGTQTGTELGRGTRATNQISVQPSLISGEPGLFGLRRRGPRQLIDDPAEPIGKESRR